MASTILTAGVFNDAKLKVKVIVRVLPIIDFLGYIYFYVTWSQELLGHMHVYLFS